MKQSIWMIFTLLLALPLTAQTTNPDSLKQYYLHTVKVVADLPGQTIGNLTLKPVTVGETDAPLNLREVFESVPGISSTFGSKDESNLRIRGFRKNEVKILVDGRPLNSGYFGNVDLNNIPLANIKDVMIIKGPSSAMYGAGTLGGVVNLITSDPSTQKWLKVAASIKRNNTNLFELSSSHSFPSWNYQLYTSREHTDGIVLSRDFQPTGYENGAVRNNSRKTVYTINGALNFDFLDYHQLGFTAGMTYIGRKEIPSSIFESKYRLYRDWMRKQATSMGTFIIGDNGTLDLMLYYDHASDHYFEYNDPNYQYLYIDSIMKNHTLGINPRYHIQLSEMSSLSFGYRGEAVYSTRKDNGNYLNWTDHHRIIHQAYTQAETQLSQSLKTTASLGLASSLTDLDPNPDLHIEPAFALIYETGSNSSMSLSVGSATAYPTMRQQFSIEHGNPDLKPQQAWKTELSANTLRKLAGLDVSLDGAVFYNRTTDLIDMYQEIYQNIYRVDSYGLEMGLKCKPASFMELNLDYAYLNYTKNSDYRLTESPRNAAGINTIFALPYGVMLSYSANYKDNRASLDDSSRYHILPAYWVHDLQLSRKWDSYKVYLGIENLFDKDYQSEYGFPEAGINFNVGCQMEL